MSSPSKRSDESADRLAGRLGATPSPEEDAELSKLRSELDVVGALLDDAAIAEREATSLRSETPLDPREEAALLRGIAMAREEASPSPWARARPVLLAAASLLVGFGLLRWFVGSESSAPEPTPETWLGDPEGVACLEPVRGEDGTIIALRFLVPPDVEEFEATIEVRDDGAVLARDEAVYDLQWPLPPSLAGTLGDWRWQVIVRDVETRSIIGSDTALVRRP